MARPPEWVRTENAACGWLPSLRDHWREINRGEREAKAVERTKRKAGDQKRSKCRCAAYPWPHRPGGGFCRHPDPPLERWQPKPGSERRPYRERYTGILRQIVRASGMHPIRDRAQIERIMPIVLRLAKEMKLKNPRLKYRNMRVTRIDGDTVTLTGCWTSAGPTM